MAHRSNPELECRIRSNVRDDDAYLAYADWLQSVGDRRGDLVKLQHAGRTEEAAAFLAKHDYLLGSLRVFGNAPDACGKHWAAEWRCGFIHKLSLDWGNRAAGGTGESAAKELQSILSLPATQFLTELHLGPAPYTEYGNGADGVMDLGPLISVLSQSNVRDTLETLQLGNLSTRYGYLYPYMTGTSVGDLSRLCWLRQLRRLYVRAGVVRLERNMLPPLLRELVIHTHELPKKHILDPILKSDALKLEELELWFGETPIGGCTASALAPLLSGQAVPLLKRLGLGNCPWADSIARVLPEAKILPQLTALNLSGGALHDKGVAAMAKNAAAFQHLAVLDLRDNALTPAGVALARTLNQNVLVDDQDPRRGREDNYSTCAVMQ